MEAVSEVPMPATVVLPENGMQYTVKHIELHNCNRRKGVGVKGVGWWQSLVSNLYYCCLTTTQCKCNTFQFSTNCKNPESGPPILPCMRTVHQSRNS